MAIGSRPLERSAREFADRISNLLNRTITNGVRLSAALAPPGYCVAGVGVTRRNFNPRLLPLGFGPGTANAHLFVAYQLTLDSESTYLTVSQSTMAVFADPARQQVLFHYDYDRVPKNGYPNPHVQLEGISVALTTIAGRAASVTRKLGDLHLPVGGRRFRPTLEDVVELLVTEGIVAPRPGWREALDEHHRVWEETQVKAAVRREPAWASDELTRLGYQVLAPVES